MNPSVTRCEVSPKPRCGIARARVGLRATCALAALTAGCTLGPNFQRPAPPEASGYTREALPAHTASAPAPGGQAQHFARGADIPGEWWTLFHSGALDTLLARALEKNADLQQAQAALRVAVENAAVQRAALFPVVTGSFSLSRQQNPNATLAPVVSSGASIYSLYTPQVSVTYVADAFGALRRQAEAAASQAEMQRFVLEATYLALSANLVSAAVQEAALRGQLQATRQIVAAQTELLAISRRQQELGQIAAADVVAQEAQLRQAEQAIAPLEKLLAAQRHLIATLAGSLPAEQADPAFELSQFQLPGELPLSLPSRLVEQRPDVRAAEANLHAAGALLGVAVANRLPEITLSAALGSVATRASELFASGTGFWGLSASLAQPIFQGGALRHREQAARAAYEQAAAQYRSTVLTAFQNVADTLRALQWDAEAFQSAAAAERSAAQTLQIAGKRVELGQAAYPTLLAARIAEEQARISLAQAHAGRLLDTVALFQALGGGWWNRDDTAKTPAR